MKITTAIYSFALCILLVAFSNIVIADHGGTSGGVCMVDRYNGDRLVMGDGLNLSFPGAPKSSLGCTANDVSLATFERIEGPTSCIAGETILVRLKGTFTSGSDERMDVGLFVAQDGGDPNSTGGQCYSDYLHPTSNTNLDLDLTGGDGPFYNAEITQDAADSCGDIKQNENAVFETGWVSLQCQDTNDDAIADVGTCTVWGNSKSDGSANKPSCSSELDVSADTFAKCTCEASNIGGIEVRLFAEIEVVKQLIPISDSGQFNLQINGADEATNVGNSGTTGKVQVSAGTSVTPGATHTVGETAGLNTNLLSYNSSISCVDRGLSTFDGGPPLTMNGSGPMNVDVDSSDDIVCTITNTNGCEATTCSDTACATYACDPTGVVGNCDTVTYLAGQICRAGSGDSCDSAEVCLDGDPLCPADIFASQGTVCRAGSGDSCDPDEVCSGVPGEMCPDDTVTSAGTVCNAGSGDMCDVDEVCSGNAGEMCPDDTIASAGTVCNPGSGDLCDPDEVCSGNADEACPDDSYEPSTTVCNAGSGDLCDPDEFCSGNPDQACTTEDNIADQGTVCRQGSGDMCDATEVCSGIADDACPADDAPGNAGNLCRQGNGVDVCDMDELCTGRTGEACPGDDALNNAGLVCRESGTGFEDCDPSEVCLGVPGSICPDDYIEPEDTLCGDQSTTQCTEPDTCNDSGICLNNNVECGSITDSSLCEFDREPTKGTCFGGSEDSEACYFVDVDNDGIGDELDACVNGGGLCEQSDQFNLLFSPDMKNWTAYRLNASNPGQTFYNLIYDASGAGTEDVTFTVTVPYPYVTVGGQPLHIYDAEAVAGDGQGCMVPPQAIRSEPMFITLDDWILGAEGLGDYNLICDAVDDPNGYGFCSFDVHVLNEEIPLSGLLYVNLHLDFGFKGQWVDANPAGPDSTGMVPDRYDRHPYISPWQSSDALVNSLTDDDELALADCQPFWFEHSLKGEDTLFEDHVENLNLFKKVSGVYGRVYCADDDSALPYYVRLTRMNGQLIASTQADPGGYYTVPYVHIGKAAPVKLEVSADENFSDILESYKLKIQKNVWWEVDFSATDCGDASEAWSVSATSGKVNQ